MSAFKDMIAADIKNVFMNTDEFAEPRTVIYDGETYKDIPVVLSGLKQQDRTQHVTDRVQGLYLVTSVMHCAADDMGSRLPERGQRIKISNTEGGGFFHEFYIASSVCEMGMFRVELEAIDE